MYFVLVGFVLGLSVGVLIGRSHRDTNEPHRGLRFSDKLVRRHKL